MPTQAIGYHACRGNKMPYKDNRTIAQGRTYRAKDNGKAVNRVSGDTCTVGMHAAVSPAHAWQYRVGADTLSLVLVDNDDRNFYVRDDKFAGLNRTHLKVVKIPKKIIIKLENIQCSSLVYDEEKIKKMNKLLLPLIHPEITKKARRKS